MGLILNFCPVVIEAVLKVALLEVEPLAETPLSMDGFVDVIESHC